MSELAHLVQDLRAEAHNAPPRHRELMRRAAKALAGLVADQPAVVPPPFPPPAGDDPRQRVKGAPCR